jgi:hypothetical protein
MPPSEATVQYEGTVRAALAEGTVDGAAAGADVVGVVELGGVVVGAVVVEGVELGATVVVVGAPLVVVGAAVVVVLLVSAPAPETGRRESPRTVVVAATARAPTRARDVLRTGRELARIVMSSKVRDGPTSPLSGANL